MTSTDREFHEGQGGVENEVIEGVPRGAWQQCWREAQRGWTRGRRFGETAHISPILLRPEKWALGLGKGCCPSPPGRFAPGTWFPHYSGGIPENATASADIDWAIKFLYTPPT
jgi:hypothetical protein